MTRLSIILGGIVAAALIAVLIGWGMLTSYVTTPGSSDDLRVVIVVPEDADGEVLASLLAEQRVVQNPDWFAFYVDRLRQSTIVAPGEYAVSTRMTPLEISDRMREGQVITYPVTIRAGLRLEAIASAIAEEGIGDAAALLSFMKGEGVAASLGLPGESLEGFLFPDIYAWPKSLDPRAVVERMVQHYRRAVTPELLAEAAKLGLDELGLVTLASLIEVDGVPAEERSMVSSVYHNRLKAGLKLQNLGAVAYGIGKPAEAATAEDLTVDHRWNTYLKPGLPPTPIANPSSQSLAAAARPAKSDALFFAPRGDGTHVFCPDEECYRIALDKWRRERKR